RAARPRAGRGSLRTSFRDTAAGQRKGAAELARRLPVGWHGLRREPFRYDVHFLGRQSGSDGRHAIRSMRAALTVLPQVHLCIEVITRQPEQPRHAGIRAEEPFTMTISTGGNVAPGI